MKLSTMLYSNFLFFFLLKRRQENANSVDYILGFPTAYFLLLLHADGARLESYTRESHYSKAIELVKMNWYQRLFFIGNVLISDLVKASLILLESFPFQRGLKGQQNLNLVVESIPSYFRQILSIIDIFVSILIKIINNDLFVQLKNCPCSCMQASCLIFLFSCFNSEGMHFIN